MVNNLIRRFDQAEFQKLVVNWIVESQQSFRQFEHPCLRQIFEYLNPAVHMKAVHVIAKTIQSLAIQQFERHRDAVQHALRRSPGQIHIAFDGARTRNCHALYGVTAVFRDVDTNSESLSWAFRSWWNATPALTLFAPLALRTRLATSYSTMRQTTAR